MITPNIRRYQFADSGRDQRKAGVAQRDFITPHCFRHGGASFWNAMAVPIDDIIARGRWASQSRPRPTYKRAPPSSSANACLPTCATFATGWRADPWCSLTISRRATTVASVPWAPLTCSDPWPAASAAFPPLPSRLLLPLPPILPDFAPFSALEAAAACLRSMDVHPNKCHPILHHLHSGVMGLNFSSGRRISPASESFRAAGLWSKTPSLGSKISPDQREI